LASGFSPRKASLACLRIAGNMARNLSCVVVSWEHDLANVSWDDLLWVETATVRGRSVWETEPPR
jgi:hypothetical protein